MYANNEEFITLQKIEKELQGDHVLFNICKQIVQQNSNIRLLQFFFEFFKILLSNSYLKDVTQKAIKIFNAFIQKSKQRNKDAQISDLSHYINQKYFDILANYYEKAVLGGIEEANKHINYIYFKKIVKDYIDQPQNQNQQSAKSILTLIEQTYKNFQGTTPSDFEIQLYESLNSEEQELFAQIVSDDQNKVAKKQESLFDKFLLTFPNDLQDRYKTQNCSTVYEFYKCLQKQKVGVEKVLGFIFQEKLNYYVNQQYLNIQTQKAKARKNDLQNTLSELEKNILEQNKDYFSFVEISYVKYFYKSIKAKKCQQSLQQNFSFRRKLLEFIKQEINAAQTPKQWKPFPQNIWQEIYQELYSNLNDINNQEDANLQFKIIQSIQQLIIYFFRFRWNYLFLFCVIIVEANFSNDELDNMINIAYDMMTSTTRSNLNIPFGKILSMFNEKAKTQITSVYFERQGQNLGYDSLLLVESQLKFINNKLIKLILQTSSFQNKVKIYGELKHFELKLMSDCREHLKNYKKVFEQLADCILEGEKEEKEWKAYFYKSLTGSYFQKWYSIYREKQNLEKNNMQQFWLYALSIQTLKQDYQNKQLGLYQDVFEREEKICNICIQFIQRDVEKIYMQFQQLQPAQQQNLEGYKELMQNFIDIFLKDNPFIIFLPSLLRGIPQNRSKSLNIEKIERDQVSSCCFQGQELK
ncbi:unnamed protein product (macronuclear) [Paramecium tetraurelia]|uniref:Uncharacterized protein n=1 Tax=Paramecium tetraurelia TaxID=5888 RepID=A0CRG6_PARTE|nr:uncharacterized protein GSPATT00009698001 [Paramecium tetraurelia]CAK73383.1 unnamed protein product [Paramecium tetraurelia]|eukprot:XP_001440780.1 hypothetical protein (macronuclear) [Paramecium tetraurelia strain d4-2]